jgi:DNA repair protein RadC
MTDTQGRSSTHSPISSWPDTEKPREKLLTAGATLLSDAELLAVLLRSGTRGKTAVALARDLLTRFGGLRGLFSARRADLCDIRGVGPGKYAQLQAAVELGRRQLAEPLKRDGPLTSPTAVREFLHARLRDRPYEVFCCLYLDNRNRLIMFEELFRGTIDGASVHPREVVRRALEHNAAALILAHNHPSGIAEPSQADEIITRRLKSALGLVDIRVLDHLIVGDGETVSFAERGLLAG